MKKVYLLILLGIAVFSFPLKSQEIKSKKAFIYINTIPETESDTIPPVIKLLSHQFNTNGRLQYDKPEINLLGKITDEKSGINRIFINRQKFELTTDGLFMQMIPLVKGENKISIVAVDNEDNYIEKTLIVDYNTESGPLATPINISGKYYALIIGINEYDDPSLTNLDYPVKDAESLYNVLNSNYLFDKDNMYLLKNVTRADINNALDILARRITT